MDYEVIDRSPDGVADDKRKAIIAFILVFFADTIARWVIGLGNQPAEVILALFTLIGTSLAVLFWCKADARYRNFETGKFFPLAIIILGFLALLWYLFRARGVGGGLTAAGKGFLLLLAVAFTSAFIEFALAFLIEDRTGLLN